MASLSAVRDAEVRRPDIRTYAVMPLNGECGFLEWVSNSLPLKANIEDMQFALHSSLQSVRVDARQWRACASRAVVWAHDGHDRRRRILAPLARLCSDAHV